LGTTAITVQALPITIGISLLSSAANAVSTDYSNLTSSGYGAFSAGVITAADSAARLIGVEGLVNSYEGQNREGAQLGWMSRTFDGVMGAVGVVTTAIPIASVARSAAMGAGSLGSRMLGAVEGLFAAEEGALAASSNVTRPFGIRTLGAAEAKLPSLPANARTAGIDEIYRRLQQYHGIDAATASERLHLGKQALGYGANDNLLFDLTGNVFDPVTREWLFSLTTP
jgi:hypothetical protein